jgi:stage II sporulation protein AA (anti-sigma F factor antagonist)
VTTEQRQIVVTLRGEFDLAERARLRDIFDSAERSSTVVLDFSNVTYIDSTVIGALVKLHGDMAAVQGRMVVVSPAPVVKRVLDMTGLTLIFHIADSMNDAKRDYHIDSDALQIEMIAGEH